MTTDNSLFTSSLNLRRQPLSCIELAHIMLAPFAKPTVEARQLVSLVLQSVHDFFDKDPSGSPPVDDELLKTIEPLSSSLMLLASRLEINLKNQVWTGDKMEVMREMYGRIVLQITSFLFATTVGNPHEAIQATLGQAQGYLSTATTQRIEQGVSSVAIKYRIPCPLAKTTDERGQKMLKGSKGLRSRLGARLRAVFKGGKREAIEEEIVDSVEEPETMAESDGFDSDYHSRVSTDNASESTAESTPGDGYHGYEHTAKMSARFISGLFSYSEPPQPTLESALIPDLARFIADALHISGLPSSVHIHALNLLQRLKQRYPTATARGKPDYRHRLYLSALMVATKFLWDGYYTNKSWYIIGQGMFSFGEAVELELELCKYLEWKLDVDTDELDEFEADLWEEYRIFTIPNATEPMSSSEEWFSLSPSSSCSSSSSRSSGSPRCQIPLWGEAEAEDEDWSEEDD